MTRKPHGAAHHWATSLPVFAFRQVGFTAFRREKRLVRSDLVTVDIDDRRQHCRVIPAVTVRTVVEEAQHRRDRSRDAAGAEIDFDRGPIRIYPATVEIARRADAAPEALGLVLSLLAASAPFRVDADV